jgi:excisionase family DNA binding protein
VTTPGALPVPPPQVPPRLLTTAQVAATCQVSEKTNYRAIAHGDLRASRLGRGGGFRVWEQDMERWIESGCVALQFDFVSDSPTALQEQKKAPHR